ncbi:MAG: Lrp/AsnC family transcriptional regulator [Firmicutes bacterium]|nr:Lrp/AsnC family transcriptional regulator [Bacillota bacterium]
MLKNDILEILENNSRIKINDVATMLGKSEEEVNVAIAELEADNVICGYSTLINWDKADKQYVSAMVEVKVTPQREQGFEKIAERIYKFDEVKAVYLMSGGFDLLVMVDGKDIKEIAYFISSKLSPIDAILSTSTHFVLKKYKDHGVIVEKNKKDDERMIVSP